MKNHIKASRSLIHNDDGSVLVMVAGTILLLVAIGGAGVDFGRGQLIKMKQQQATDTASLAAANVVPQGTHQEKKIRLDTIDRYYNLNFPANYLGVTENKVSSSINNGNGDITVTNTAAVKTSYLTLSGVDNLNIGTQTVVSVGSLSKYPDFDIAMVIDESGSTDETPDGFTDTIINTEKDAIFNMLNGLFPSNQPPNPNLRFGLVGYTGAIVDAYGLTSDKAQAQSYTNNLTPYDQNYDHWGLEAGFNMVTGVWNGFVPPKQCVSTPPSYPDGIVFPIDNSYSTLDAGCTPNYQCTSTYTVPANHNDGTAAHQECNWTDLNDCPYTYTYVPPTYPPGWVPYYDLPEQCVPEHNVGVPAPVTLRSDGALSSKAKYVIFITDGYIMEEPSPCDSGNWYQENYPDIDTETYLPDDTCNNYAEFLRQCDAIKAAGVTLYTINFVSKVADDVAPMSACASEPAKYFYAPDASTLRSTLTGIADSISKVRITQ